MSCPPVRVVCVDDNEWIGESIQRVLAPRAGYAWAGWYDSCTRFLEGTGRDSVEVVVLDLDIPGEDAFESLASITTRHPEAKVLILSGYLSTELVDRALGEGAWGYISKNEAAATVLDAIGRVAAGEIALSPAVAEEYRRH
jgi:two-component system, NarL family, invasion response regulator UvrY